LDRSSDSIVPLPGDVAPLIADSLRNFANLSVRFADDTPRRRRSAHKSAAQLGPAMHHSRVH